MGGFRRAMESLLASPATAPLLTRERVSPLYFFSYTFIPLSSIAFPHIGIFCLTAKRLVALQEDGRPLSDLHARDLAAVGVPRRRRQPGAPTCRRSRPSSRRAPTLAAPGRRCRPSERDRLRAAAAGDDVILRLVEGYAPLWLAALLGAAVMAAVMASDSQILALSTMFTEDVFAFYGGPGALRRGGAGADRAALRRPADASSPISSRCGCRSRSSTSPPSTRSPATRRCRRCWWRRCSGSGSTKWGALASDALDGGGGRSASRCCRRSSRRRRPGAAVPVLAVGGVDIITRAAAGTMVLGLLPVVPMTLISALLMVVVSR